MNKIGIAKQYRDRYGKGMPTLKLARIMYNENKLLFKDVDEARYKLRYIEGKTTHGNLTNKHKNYIIPEHRPKNPYNLPDSDETKYEPYILKYKKPLILSDVHVPYHSITALTAAIDYGKHIIPDSIILNGDFYDFFGLSRFLKDPRKRSFSEELDSGSELIKKLKKIFDVPIIFKVGNHEERYNHFLWQKAHEIIGVEELNLFELIKKRAGDIEYVDKKRIIKAGKLNVIHGHEFVTGISAPVNIARGLFLKGKVSALQGHNHSSSEHTEPTMNGDIITTWSVGCLSELHPDYMPINKWNHGCASIHIQPDGNFEVENKRIYSGKVL
jgi:predicted phosphodiesterase